VCIIIVMLGAILLIHLPHGFGISKGGMEYAFTQLLIAIALPDRRRRQLFTDVATTRTVA
jgi:hypothetical protein